MVVAVNGYHQDKTARESKEAEPAADSNEELEFEPIKERRLRGAKFASFQRLAISNKVPHSAVVRDCGCKMTASTLTTSNSAVQASCHLHCTKPPISH